MEEESGLRPIHIRLFAALSVFSGLAALFFTFAEKSEAKNARLGGYSLSRWGLGLVTAVLILLFLRFLLRDLRSDGAFAKRLGSFLSRGDRAWFAFLGALFCLYLSLWAFKFSWLFIPKTDAARMYTVYTDDATGIGQATADKDATDEIYNLNGQRVAAPAKGLYIRNNKKVIIK